MAQMMPDCLKSPAAGRRWGVPRATLLSTKLVAGELSEDYPTETNASSGF